MKTNQIKKLITVCIIMILAITTSCKKEANQLNNPNLVGLWSHVQQVGLNSDILTQLDLKQDGSGKKTIMRITTSSTTTTAEDNLSWKTNNNNTLILQVDGESEINYSFEIANENTELKLTEIRNGITTEFFKSE